MTNFDPKPHGKPILCMDFDGVIHSYKSGWKGAEIIPDDPVDGVFDWMRRAMEKFEIHVYSSRSQELLGRAAMHTYIKSYAPDIVDELVFSDIKPRAFLTIDDRAILFDGNWKSPYFDPDLLINFKPWYKP